LVVVLKEVYECIVDIYISFRIEVICSDINNLQPLSPFDPINVKDFDYLKPLDPDQEAPPADSLVSALNQRTAATPAKKPKKASTTMTIKDISGIEAHIKRSVIGQDEAVEKLVQRIKLIAVGFDKRANFFFVGRTGVGKTELARSFGKKYCNNFAKINCGEFTNGHEVAKLIGAPPGYIGSNHKSFFQEKAEVSNRWVFLFDEVEKAHEKLYHLLLSLLDDGTVTDSNGNTLDFSNSIFIFTSNQGISEIKEISVGFGGKGHNSEAAAAVIKASLDKQFSPEFRNRIDEFIFFNELTTENVKDITKLNLKTYPVAQTEELLDFIVSKAYSKEFGVREIKRFIKNSVALPVAEAILDNQFPIDGSGKYTFTIKDGKAVVDNVKKVPVKAVNHR
jgi:ATP-dependent Clp protease ATP-binding subunit ClpA